MSNPLDTHAQAALAAARYGLGPAPGDLDRITGDPVGWLRNQLRGTPQLPSQLAGVPDTVERLARLMQARAEGNAAIDSLFREQGREWHLADLTARTAAAIETEAPFVERLVHFWSNHFTVSTTKLATVLCAVSYENEAIRPHVLGRFSDMLRAVAEHPAMLIYLDNAQSVGPDSRLGQRVDRGLNENLAREILELHTLGVDGGYGQQDVRALAEILTGWSIARQGEANPGAFRYRPFIHQPGDKILLGETYREGDQDEGIAALQALARHPATARHVSVKLARHFIADDPPVSVIDRLTGTYIATDGDLGAMAGTLVDLIDEIENPLGKVRSPHDYVVAAMRAFNGVDHSEKAVISMRLMGQMPFNAPSPAGWPDRAEGWIGPDALSKRIDWAVAVGQRMPAFVNPVRIAQNTIWPLASAESRFQIEAAPSVADGIALLLASPEFQRR